MGRIRVGRAFGTALGGSGEPVEVQARHLLGIGVDLLQDVAHVPLHRLGDSIGQELLEDLARGVVPRYGCHGGVACRGHFLLGQVDHFLTDPHGEVTGGGLVDAQQADQGVGEGGGALETCRVEGVRRLREHSGQFLAGRQNHVVLSQ